MKLNGCPSLAWRSLSNHEINESEGLSNEEINSFGVIQCGRDGQFRAKSCFYTYVHRGSLAACLAKQ